MIEPLSSDLTREDFLRSGWQEVVDSCPLKTCRKYADKFAAKAQEFQESGDLKNYEIFLLFGAVCILNPRLDKPEEVFGSFQLDESRLVFLNEILDEINDAELKARVADILCLRKPHYKLAEKAITAYIESAKILEDPEHWNATYDRIRRALQLATRWGKNTDRFKDVIKHIEEVLAKYDGNDPRFLSVRLMSLLQNYGEGDAAQNAIRAQKLALAAESNQDWQRARECWETKARWHLSENEEEQARQAMLFSAETYVKQSKEPLKLEQPNYMQTVVYLQSAIQAFRRVSDTRDRIQEIHKELLKYQELGVTQLIPMSENVDISDLVKQSQEKVQGKSLEEVLLILSQITQPASVDHLREMAEKYNKEYLFKSFFPTVRLNSRGKVIARQPQNKNEAIEADMQLDALHIRNFKVQAYIEPARKVILSEHPIEARDFMPYLTNNPFVPPGREWIIATGLSAGLWGDFLTATHLLIPQIESSMRYFLFALGIITSGYDTDGIQDEYDLNKILRLSQFTEPIIKYLGNDFIVDLKGLLVSRFGSNLRNDMAHGLISHNAFYSSSASYLWWFALMFYFLPHLSIVPVGDENSEQETKDLEDDATA